MAGVSCVRVVPPPPSPPRVPPVPVVSTAPPLVPPNPPPAPALLDERARLTFALMSGYRAPFAAPKSFAAAWASAQDCRVAGLLRSARSTTSVSENVDEPVPAESAARAAVAPGAWGGVGGGGGVCAATATVHGTAGLGGAPGTPSMRGVPGAEQAAASASETHRARAIHAVECRAIRRPGVQNRDRAACGVAESSRARRENHP